MRTIKMIAFAAVMIAALACGSSAKKEAKVQMPQESLDSVSYLFGVNNGMFLNQVGCFDEFAELDQDKYLSGSKDGYIIGGPTNPYMQDTLWAEKFLINPYDIDKTIEGYKERKGIKESVDSVSYLLGVHNGVMLKSTNCFDEFAEINKDQFMTGVQNIFTAGMPANPYMQDTVWAAKFQISPYEMNKVINGYIVRRQYAKEKIAFFDENRKKANVRETPSGLQYIIYAEGEGDKVAPQDTVIVNYRGTLLDGTQFDANDSIQFVANRVIKGWTEGLGLLGKGGKATLYIPSKLGYGPRPPYGSRIEPNSILVFEIDLLDIKKGADQK